MKPAPFVYHAPKTLGDALANSVPELVTVPASIVREIADEAEVILRRLPQ